MSRLPFRWRLTIWYGALLAGALIAFAILLLVGLRWRLTTAFDDQIRSQVELTLSTVTFANGQIQLDTGEANLNEQEYYLRLVDLEGGEIVARGMPPIDFAASDAAITAALGGSERLLDLDAGGDVELRLLTVPVRAPGDPAVQGALQVGIDRTDLDETLTQLLIALIALIPVVLVVAVGGGYLLAGRLLRPLAQVTGMARDMSEHALHERLNLDLPDDELGRLAGTFDEMLARIEQAFERQRRFTADAAHELRTPLSLMRSQIDLALSRPRTPAEYRDALQGLEADLSRLTGLAQALLAIARLERPQLNLERARFDVADTLAATLAAYEPVLSGAGITARLDAVPAEVLADEDMIIQVLVNLLDNAVAHTPAGGEISAGNREAREGVGVTIWIADTGAGIAPADQARVFDRFYRPDAGRGRAQGGAGLGLAICKAIVEAHDGTITLASALGKGTRVTITLPNPDSQVS